MGCIYSIAPIDIEVVESVHVIGINELPEPSRMMEITAKSVIEALERLDGFSYKTGAMDKFWQAKFENDLNEEEYSTINGFGYENENSPMAITFEKGDPKTIAMLVKELSSVYGAIIIVPDTGDDAIVVNHNTNISQVNKEWPHAAYE